MTLTAATLRTALAALKLQIAPLHARDSDLQAQWSRAAGRIKGVRANHAEAARIAALREEGAAKLAELNRARVEIENALEGV